MTLRLRIRRFYCQDSACRRRTFAEPLPQMMPPRARRTRRLAQAQTRIGLAAGGEAGARLTGHLGMQTSPDTILRLVRRLPLPSVDRPRAVGIDDWAIRKGQTYGTLLVDLDRRCPIDLLPNRTGATVTDWLRRHPGIRIVARDRSTEYARAATAGAPAALQVADRMLVRGCGLDGDRPADAVGELDRWLFETRTCGVAASETFAAGLAQDRPAVRAALTTSWSNAQAEGQISRLKMLKRTMYGRASFGLLRRRMLLAA